MLWLNLYEYDPIGSTEFLIRAKENKGKFVKVYDDITGEELTDLEIKELEADREKLPVPLMDENSKQRVIKVKERKQLNRKYKSRIPISQRLRKIVLELNDGKCNQCGTDANQIHHLDENPSNNHTSNLQLLCYNCHLKKHKKK